jgi:predicted ATPase
MLRSEAMAGAVADVTTRRNAANANLTAAFEQSWNQQGIAVQIEVQGTILHVQATTPEDSGVSDIAERSDGMRWFAALLAFAHGWERQPILLVDEIERHLHYDAQADLIEVLSKQEFTSK